MSLFRWNWLRRMVRQRTNEIPLDTATLWSKRLSIAYAVISWHAFGVVAYLIYNGKNDWAKYHGLKTEDELKMSPGQQWAKTLGIKNATVYRISGFEVTKYDTKETEENENI